MEENANGSISITLYKWTKDLNINPLTLNLIEKKVENTLEHICTGDHFLNIAPVAQTLRTTINKWNLLKLTKGKDTVNKANNLQIGKRSLPSLYLSEN